MLSFFGRKKVNTFSLGAMRPIRKVPYEKLTFRTPALSRQYRKGKAQSEEFRPVRMPTDAHDNYIRGTEKSQKVALYF